MARTKFPNVLAAVEAREKHLVIAEGSDLWAIGAALIRDCRNSRRPLLRGDHDGSHALLAAASEELAEHGYPTYDPRYLSSIMVTTEMFPVNRRQKHLSFSHHVEAQNPEILDWIVKSFVKRTDDDEISKRYIRDMVVRWHERLQQKHKRKHDEAKDKRRRARTKAEIEEADAEIEATEPPPSKRTMSPPEGDEAIAVLKELDVLKNAREAKRLAVATKADIKDAVNQLDDTAIAVLSEACLEAMNAWKDVADTVRKATENKRGHLAALQGGRQ